MRIAEYKTATAADPEELDRVVSRLIEEGFQPFGSVYPNVKPLTAHPETQLETWQYAQPMVRYAANP